MEALNLRDFSKDKHKRVDDYPYSGKPGMIFKIEPVRDAFSHICEKNKTRPYFIYMSPCGKVFTQEDAKRLAGAGRDLAILCGHYEGVDQRIIENYIDEEISLAILS